MKRLGLTIFKNATANVVRGGATAAVAVALPHFLAHSLDVARFSAWSLILQIAAYAGYLDFGLQTAVARFVAQALELEQYDRLRELIDTAFTMLSAAAVLAITGIGVIIFFGGSFFHGVPPYLLHEFQISAMILALSAAALLPLSTFTGVLIGMHQNEFPALAIGGSRLLGAAAAIVASRYTNNLIALALCIALPNLAGGLLQVMIVRHRLSSARIRRLSIHRGSAVAFLRYCVGLTTWAFGMLLVSGLDVTIVGHYQFRAVGYYAIAATFTSIFAGANGSVLSALLAPFAAMQASGKMEEMRVIIIRATRANSLFNMSLTVLVITFGLVVLKLWVGLTYAQQAYPILVLLMVTQTLRLMMSAYSVALMGTGHQNSGILPVLIEAFTNLVASLWSVIHYGPIGVAVGSLVGVLVSLPFAFLFTVKSRSDLNISRVDLGIRGMLTGALPALPALLCAAILELYPQPTFRAAGLWGIALALGAVLYLLLNKGGLKSGRDTAHV